MLIRNVHVMPHLMFSRVRVCPVLDILFIIFLKNCYRDLIDGGNFLPLCTYVCPTLIFFLSFILQNHFLVFKTFHINVKMIEATVSIINNQQYNPLTNIIHWTIQKCSTKTFMLFVDLKSPTYRNV